jgi:dihydrofolate reductase
MLLRPARKPPLFFRARRDWNKAMPLGFNFAPAGATCAALGAPNRRVGVIGGTDVFGLFLDLYDVFHMTQAPHVRLPRGRPVFPGVPARTPEEVLAKHALVRRRRRLLDRSQGLAVQAWIRSPS